MPAATVSVDLLESADVRTYRAGYDVAERLLARRPGHWAVTNG